MYKISLLVLLFFLSGHAWAANYDNPIDGVFRNIYGDSITIGVPSLVSKSPAYNNQNGELTFQVNAGTAYKNFNQLTDLKEGDPVRVEYKDNSSGKDNQMVATGITKLGDAPVNAASVITTPSSTVQTVTTTTTTRVNPQ
jgi:hypothetical protein